MEVVGGDLFEPGGRASPEVSSSLLQFVLKRLAGKGIDR